MKILKNADIILCCILLVAFTIFAFLQVLFRFVFNLPISWTDEMVRYCMVTLVYVSAIYSIRQRSAIRVEILDMFIKGKAKLVLDTVINVISAAAMIYLSYLTTFLIKNAISVDQRSAAMQIPLAIMYVIECVCFFGMGAAFISLIVADMKKLKKGEIEE